MARSPNTTEGTMRTLLAFIILSASVYAAEPARLLPRPTGDVLEKAEKEIRSIFDTDLTTALKPSEKAKLAKELLKVARETTNHDAERFVLCVLARDLAIAGRDKATAFAASQAIAERYLPDGPTDGKEQFERGQATWKEAEKARGDERLKMQADAAEWYAYARPTATGINLMLVEKRLRVEEEKATDAKPRARADTKSKDTEWSIAAKDSWQPTIKVKRWQKIEISATGTWQWGAKQNATCGPEGLPNAGWLECRIGNGPAVKVGKSVSIIADSDGTLQFQMNDPYRSDNSGGVTVRTAVHHGSLP